MNLWNVACAVTCYSVNPASCDSEIVYTYRMLFEVGVRMLEPHSARPQFGLHSMDHAGKRDGLPQ